MGQETDETEAPWDGTLGEKVQLFLTGRRKMGRAASGEAPDETGLRRSEMEEPGRTATGEESMGKRTAEMQMAAERESMAAVSHQLFQTVESERATRLAITRQGWTEQPGNDERAEPFLKSGQSEEIFQTAEKFDRLVEREARRYNGPFSLF